jgi:glycosyltransferase involved in cell wall biosynthesis
MQNTYIPKFTYVIPFRYRHDRIIPLKRVIDWLSGFQGIEVLLIEQDKHSKIEHLNLRVIHHFINNDGPFNKGWAFNYALKRAKSNFIIFGDADFVMDPNDLIQALKTLETCDCVIPTSNIVSLSYPESVGDMPTIFSIKRPGFKSSMTNGISLFTKSAISKIGGWNEDLLGIGFTNKFQDMKITKFLNFRLLEATGYHLFHNPDGYDSSISQHNTKLMEFYNGGDDNKLLQHINMTLPKIGFGNRYS